MLHKSNVTKHIAPKLFYPHKLQESGEINILQIKSCDNLADLFTKSLPTSMFQKLVHGIGMRRLWDLPESGGTSPKWWHVPPSYYTLFFHKFYLQGFLLKFLMR